MLPHLIGRRGPGRANVVGDTGGASGVGDGGFVEPPVVSTTASGNTTIKGKVKPGSFGKFVVPLATIAAGRQYTFRYTPQFSQLAQHGKFAMVGFGFKNNNDFHIVGLRGDGSTGVHKYIVDGTPPNGWNAQTGHTVVDGGVSAAGSQAGPNYMRLVTSADGTTYTYSDSSDGVAWSAEITAQAPSPFSNVSGVTTFGVALWFNNADAGPFSIQVDQFADVVAPVGILDGLSPSSAISLSRDLLSAYAGGSRYSDVAGAITQFTDQSGNARNFTDASQSGRRPTLTTAGPNSRACADFDGTSDTLTGAALSNFISAGSGLLIVSCIIDAITANNATAYLNDPLFADAGQEAGIFLRNTAGGTAYAYNWDGNEDKASATLTTATPYVLHWRHEGGNVYMGINGTETSVASGDTQSLTGLLQIGGNAGNLWSNCKVFEAATFSTVPATLSAVISDMRTWIGA